MPITDENIFIAATCQDKGLAFLKGEAAVGVRKVEPTSDTGPTSRGAATGKYDLKINDRLFQVALDGPRVTVNGRTFEVDVQPASASSDDAGIAASTEQVAVNASMPGVVLKASVQIGDHINQGDTVIVLEAMKMEVNATASVAGTIASIDVNPGDQVVTGQRLATIAK